MNIKTVAFLFLSGFACGFAGCATSTGDGAPTPVENISVSLAQGRTLNGAIMAAASSRRWLPQTQPDGSIRCTLSQREHLVIVDVVPVGEAAFSIRPVQSNIPARKYDQWVGNLSREIVYRASR